MFGRCSVANYTDTKPLSGDKFCTVLNEFTVNNDRFSVANHTDTKPLSGDKFCTVLNEFTINNARCSVAVQSLIIRTLNHCQAINFVLS